MAITIAHVKQKPGRALNSPLKAARQKVSATSVAENASESAGETSSPFEAAFQAHWQRLCGVLYRLVGDREEAEDLALEALWRLYHRPPGQESNLAGWLYRVATNLGFNALRSRKRRRRYEEEAGIRDLQQAGSLDPAIQAERTEQTRLVRRVLTELNPRSARLLVMRHSGFSYAEIAATLEVSASSVGTLLARAEDEFEKRYRALERSEI